MSFGHVPSNPIRGRQRKSLTCPIPMHNCKAPHASLAFVLYAMTTRENGRRQLVAVVDDDESLRMALQGLLKAAGLKVRSFASAEDFLKSGEQHQTGCLIADIRMPGMSGLDLQLKLKAENCPIPTIFITAHGDEKMRLRAMRADALEFLPKPFDDGRLLECVRTALES
jgi:FixJ family two-component response regulator